MDGARAALTGYLYQFLGVCALRAQITESGSDFITAILPGARIGQLHHELYSDAFVCLTQSATSACETVAIQFKYSADGALITRKDLIEIIHGLEQSRRAAGSQTISRYLLVTNRLLDGNANALLAMKNHGQRPKELLLVKSGAAQPAQWKSTILKSYSNAADAADKWWAVLKALDCRTGLDFATGQNSLRDYASAHGLPTEEHDAAIERVVGALFLATTQGAPEISEEWLKTHLLGAGRAARLRFPREGANHIIDRCRNQLEELFRRTTDLAHAQLVRRDVQTNIRAEAAKHPVVFVYGSGGVGKSTEVVQHLLRLELAAVGLVADTASDSLLDTTFHQLWTGEGESYFPRNVTCRAETRLATANPAAPATFLVAIDGVDEAAHLPERKQAIRSLIKRFWANGDRSATRSTLIVCCRARPGVVGAVEDDLVSEWFDCENPATFRSLFGFVSIGDFDDEELATAAQNLRSQPEERLLAHLAPGSAAIGAGLAESPVFAEVVESLHHPVVWGTYAEEKDPSRRSEVLDGSPTALNTLAARFIGRFLRKCSERGCGNQTHLRDALVAIARVTGSNRPFSRLEHWVKECQDILGPRDAKALYDEALGYGLIQPEEPGTWRWKHRFVAGYLGREANNA